MRIKFSSNVVEKYKFLLLGAISVILLTLGFGLNQWRAIETNWFEGFQMDSESLVIGRLIKAQQDGVFSEGGLTGRMMVDGIDNVFAYQYLIYIKNLPAERFVPYQSQIGFQAILFSLLDKGVNFSNYDNIRFFKFLTAVTSAIALTLIVLWCYRQFGLTVGIVILTTTLYSQWLVVFGRNMWWVIGAFYLPFITSLAILHYEERKNRYSHKTAAILIFLAVFAKCLMNGYEYITTTLVMMVAPFVYYAIYKKWTFGEFFKRVVIISVSAIVAVFLSFGVLIFQIASVEGDLAKGVSHIIYSFGKRSYGNANSYNHVYRASLDARVSEVLLIYLKGIAIDLNNLLLTKSSWLSTYLQISFKQLILLFLLATTVGVALLKYAGQTLADDKIKLVALISVTWFSILAPFSWFVVFKSHSYQHTHMNYLVWQMPFTLFGFALSSLVVKLFMMWLGKNCSLPLKQAKKFIKILEYRLCLLISK